MDEGRAKPQFGEGAPFVRKRLRPFCQLLNARQINCAGQMRDVGATLTLGIASRTDTAKKPKGFGQSEQLLHQRTHSR